MFILLELMWSLKSNNNNNVWKQKRRSNSERTFDHRSAHSEQTINYDITIKLLSLKLYGTAFLWPVVVALDVITKSAAKITKSFSLLTMSIEAALLLTQSMSIETWLFLCFAMYVFCCRDFCFVFIFVCLLLSLLKFFSLRKNYLYLSSTSYVE